MAKGKQVRIDHEAYDAVKNMSEITRIPMSVLISDAIMKDVEDWQASGEPAWIKNQAEKANDNA